MKSTTNYALWYTEATASVACEAWGRMMREPFVAFYFYFQPHGLRFYVVRDDEPVPPGAELVTGERMPSDRTVEQLTMWVRDLAGKVPVFPT